MNNVENGENKSIWNRPIGRGTLLKGAAGAGFGLAATAVAAATPRVPRIEAAGSTCTKGVDVKGVPGGQSWVLDATDPATNTTHEIKSSDSPWTQQWDDPMTPDGRYSLTIRSSGGTDPGHIFSYVRSEQCGMLIGVDLKDRLTQGLPTVTPLPVATNTPVSTYTPLPTYTPAPTYTPFPTATEVPRPSPSPSPEPLPGIAQPPWWTPDTPWTLAQLAAVLVVGGAIGAALMLRQRGEHEIVDDQDRIIYRDRPRPGLIGVTRIPNVRTPDGETIAITRTPNPAPDNRTFFQRLINYPRYSPYLYAREVTPAAPPPPAPAAPAAPPPAAGGPGGVLV